MKVLFTPPKNLFNVSKLLFLALFALTPLISKAYAWDGSSIAKEYDGGRGTSESPYQIADGSQLAFLAH